VDAKASCAEWDYSVSNLQDVLTSGVEAYGEIVWSWRRKAGAKRANLFAGDGGNRA